MMKKIKVLNYRAQMIEALQAGNLEQVKLLKPEFEAEAGRERWLSQYIIDGKGSVPISAWLEPNSIITFK